MRIRRSAGLWMGALLIAVIGCGADGVTPDVDGDPGPLPPATVISVTPRRAVTGPLDWGTEVHVVFSRDPGLVKLDHGYGPIVPVWVGSGTLRAFIAQTEPTSLTWGEGESYDLGEVTGSDVQGPTLDNVVPDLYAITMASAEDLNAAGITLTFSHSMSPPGDDPNRLIQLWEVAFLEVEDIDAGVTWEPSYSVMGVDLAIAGGQDSPFAPGTTYALIGLIADTFGGHVSTHVDIRFSTE